MSAPAPPPAPKSPPSPLTPPEEQFWERYSPHYEFPLSSVGSVAMHIGALVLFLGALWLLSRMTISDKTAVPMRAVSVAGEGDGPDGMGSGGGVKDENINPLDQPKERHIPEAVIKDTVDDIKEFLPRVPIAEEGLRPEDLPNVPKIAALSDDLRRKLLEGSSGKRGAGPGDGTGTSGVPGAGSGTQGDPTSSAARSLRWGIDFKTANARDLLNQLSILKATIVMPHPPDAKSAKAYRNLRDNPAVGEPFNKNELPGVYFVYDDSTSDVKAAEVAKELGLDIQPSFFIAFFPPEIAEELAAKERAYRGRKEGEIFSTTFKILIRDGRPSITVTEQKAVR